MKFVSGDRKKIEKAIWDAWDERDINQSAENGEFKARQKDRRFSTSLLDVTPLLGCRSTQQPHSNNQKHATQENDEKREKKMRRKRSRRKRKEERTGKKRKREKGTRERRKNEWRQTRNRNREKESREEEVREEELSKGRRTGFKE